MYGCLIKTLGLNLWREALARPIVVTINITLVIGCPCIVVWLVVANIIGI